MSGRQKKILIISIIIILLIIIAMYFLFFQKSDTAKVTEVGQPASAQPEPQTEEPKVFEAPTSEFQAPSSDAEYGSVKNLAISFTERFGSYSNQADYENLEELKVLMTPKMKNWATNFIDGARQNNPPPQTYYAITAKALTTQKVSFNASAGRAEFLIKCQRQEVVSSPDNPRAFYQDIKITLVKSGADWKVDSAYWQ